MWRDKPGSFSIESIVRAAGRSAVSTRISVGLSPSASPGGRHWDQDGKVLTSWAGAIGVLQVKPSTLREMDPGLDPSDPFQNALGGSCLLRQHFDRHVLKHPASRAWRLALKDYHAGRWRRSTKQATHDYATAVISGSAQ